MPQYVISIMRSPDGGTGQPGRQECGRSSAVTLLIRDWKRCVVGDGEASPVRVGDAVGGGAGLVVPESGSPRPHPVAATIRAVSSAALLTSRLPAITPG
jgi:hypothetical protein